MYRHSLLLFIIIIITVIIIIGGLANRKDVTCIAIIVSIIIY